jgi:hypothetical protein
LIRLLTFLSWACWLAALVLIIDDAERNLGYIIVVILIASVISVILGVRAAYLRARGFASDARAFLSGDIQSARLISVSEPKGLFSPSSEVTVELEGEDGKVHNFSHDVPVPFPYAWGYRLGKRFNLPILRSFDPTALMASELRREGLKLTVSRPEAATAQPPA